MTILILKKKTGEFTWIECDKAREAFPNALIVEIDKIDELIFSEKLDNIQKAEILAEIAFKDETLENFTLPIILQKNDKYIQQNLFI